MELEDDLVGEDEALAVIGGQKTPISRATLWRGVKAGRYPAPIKIGPASNRWWLRELLAVREAASAARGAK